MAGQEWSTSALGGTLTSETLSRKARFKAQKKCRFRQLVRVELEFGAHNGDYISLRKFGDLQDAGKKVGEKEKVPETQFLITSGQVQVGEYTNSVPYTQRLSLFAKLSIEDATMVNLTNDMVKTLDHAAAEPFRDADIIYTPTGNTTNKDRALATNGTPADTATRNISAWDIRNIVDDMRSVYNIPAYDGNDYLCVASSVALRGLKEDSDWVEAAKYGDPEKLFSGEVGRYYGCRFIEENNSLTHSMAGGLGEMIFMGWDPVVEIVAYPEEIQAKIGSDYGRDRAIRWVYFGGWGKTWDYAADGEARMVRVYSL
jgi:N4-gp56 family major capsid protein